MSATSTAAAKQQPGNQVFLSFVRTLYELANNSEHPLSASDLKGYMRSYGEVLGRSIAVEGDLDATVSNFCEAMNTLGLIRIAEASDTSFAKKKIRVSKCLFDRYVGTQIGAQGQKYFSPVAPLLEGVLKAGGMKYACEASKFAIIRSDQYYLMIGEEGEA